MRYIFKFPDIGEGITEGTILEWYVQKGQSVKSGDYLVKMETDKVVADIPSPKSGVLSAIFGNVGETVNVEDPLVEIEIIGINGEAAQEFAKVEKKDPEPFEVEEKGYGVVGTLEIASDNAILSSSKEGVENNSEILPPPNKNPGYSSSPGYGKGFRNRYKPHKRNRACK